MNAGRYVPVDSNIAATSSGEPAVDTMLVIVTNPLIDPRNRRPKNRAHTREVIGSIPPIPTPNDSPQSTIMTTLSAYIRKNIPAADSRKLSAAE